MSNSWNGVFVRVIDGRCACGAILFCCILEGRAMRLGWISYAMCCTVFVARVRDPRTFAMVHELWRHQNMTLHGAERRPKDRSAGVRWMKKITALVEASIYPGTPIILRLSGIWGQSTQQALLGALCPWLLLIGEKRPKHVHLSLWRVPLLP